MLHRTLAAAVLVFLAAGLALMAGLATATTEPVDAAWQLVIEVADKSPDFR